MLSASLSGALKSLRERSQFFFSLLPAGRRPIRLREPARVPGRKWRRIPGLAAGADPAGVRAGEPAVEAGGSFQLLAARAGVAGAAWLPDGIRRSQHVFWIERRRGGRDKQNVFLQATPIDVAPILKTCLFDKLECAVLTSATLAVGGGFEYMRQRLGLEHAREAVLPSHFDYRKPGAVLCAARSARSAHTAIRGQGGRPHPATAGDHAAGGPSSCSPATRR